MKDINDMSLKDFNNLNHYLNIQNRKSSGKIVPLKQSQRDMIEDAKRRIKK